MLENLINSFNIVVFIFILTYILIIIYYNHKTKIIWTSIALLFILQIINIKESLFAINWNVILIYIGMLFISEMFIFSRVPNILAEKIVLWSPKVWIAMLGVCAFSGIMSIAVENVAVVLIVAPVAVFIAQKAKISPIPLIIGIAICSNLQGVATMIGDPPSLLLANYANLNFMDFFFFQEIPGLFFIVQIAFIAGLIVLYLFYKKNKKHMENLKPEKMVSLFPSIIFLIMIFFMITLSFFDYHGTNTFVHFLDIYKIGLICLLAGIVVWVWYSKYEPKNFLPITKTLDWDTALFLIGIFIIVQSLIKIGFISWFASKIALLCGGNVFLAYNVIIWSSVIFSGFVDNVPFIAAMLPVVGNVAEIMGIPPYLFFFGLVIGASVGGNITPVGASANIVAMGILKKRGYKTKFIDFVKIGLPFTLASVISSTMIIWFLFA